jgi:hypothetical protein
MLLQLEYTLHNLYLRRGSLQPTERRPIIHNEPRGQHITAPIDSSGTERNLQQIGQLIELLDRGLWVHQPSIVIEHAVGADQHVVGHGGSEDLDAEGVLDDLLGLFVEVGVDQGHVVVAGDAVAQR